MIDARGDRGSDTGESDLADAARPKFVDFFIGKINEMHLELWHIGVHRHNVVGQIAVDRRAVLRVVRGVLQQRHANSHHDRALDLVAASQRIDDATGIDHSHDSADAQSRDLWLPCDFDEMTTERVRRELRIFLAKHSFRLSGASGETKIGAPK